METIFHCAEKTGRQISLVGRSMHRIYKAARQCGYMKNTMEPIDPREAKSFAREKIDFSERNKSREENVDYKAKHIRKGGCTSSAS